MTRGAGLTAAWSVVLLLHAATAIAAWLLLPRGFAPMSARYVSNELGPPLLFSAAASLLVAGIVWPRAAAPLHAALPALWLALGISLWLVFPITGRRLGLTSIAVGLALCPFTWLSIRQGRRRGLALVAAAIGAAFAVVIVSCLKPPAPSTAPTEARPARYAGEPAAPVDDRDVELTPSLRVNPSRSQVDLQLPGLMVTVWPRLELFDGSPDGFWTVFGHPTWRPAPASIVSREGKTLSAWQADGALALRVGDTGDGGASIEAWSELASPAWSHLGSYASVMVRGHTRLAARFSACPDALTELAYVDPAGSSNARFATIDPSGAFRVLEAAAAEKGPFVELSRGQLDAGEPLVIELVEMGGDRSTRVLAIVLSDWSAQASTAPSPTAGYGVPMNAIELRLAGPEPSSAAWITTTLAGTGIGRGWDAVAHAPGRYVNHMTIRR